MTQADIDQGGSITNVATADSNQTDPATDELQVPVVQASKLSVDKSADTAEVSAPGVVKYTYVVKNEGNTTLTGVTLSDNKLGAISCPVTELAPGASTTCTAQYAVTQADIDQGGSITNVATADSDQTEAVYDTVSITVVQASKLSVDKSADTAEVSAPGVVKYTYVVKNEGNTTLTGVTLSDNKLGAISCPVTELAPGASTTCTAQYAVTQADIDQGGSITNVATADSDQTEAVYDTVSITVVQASKLSVDKSADTAEVSAPGVVKYTYVVKNEGNTTLTGVTLSDNKLGAISCPVTELAPGASTTCTAQYTVTQADIDQGGSITNVATADSDQTEAVYDTVSITVVQASKLSVDKSADTAEVSAPGVVKYTYVVKNEGNTTLTGVTLSDNKLGAISCPVTELAPGASTTCTAQYTVTQADIDQGGSITNVATADSNQTDPATDKWDIQVLNTPGLTVEKSSTTAEVTKAGQVIVYAYLLTNSGNTTLTGVTLKDDKLGVISCPVTELAPGASTTCTAQYTVTQADIDQGGSITNVATADSDQTDPATDELQVPVVQASKLSVDKSADTAEVSAPGVVKYTYVVKNEGNTTLTGVTLSDNKLGAISCPVTELAPGASTTCTAQYAVTQADIDQGGSITNVATADSDQTEAVYDTVSITVVQASKLSVDKSADTAEVSAPGVVKYTYVVKNEGNTTLTGVTLSDNKLGAISCPVTELAPGASTTCTAQYTVTQADIDQGGSITNVATADSDQTEAVYDTVSITVVQASKLSVDKSADTAEVSAPGVVKYTYVVKNEGNTTLTGVTLSDNKLGAISCPVTELAPGASTTCTAQYAVTQADIDQGGSITNVATADSDQTEAVYDTVSITVVQASKLSVDKSADTAEVSAPGVVKYTYVVKNEGNTTLTGVTLKDDKLGAISCPVTELAPGASTTCTAQYTVTQADIDQGGSITNVATADSNQTDPATDSLAIPVAQNPALSVDKSSNTAKVTESGQVVEYTYVVANIGNVTLHNVTLSDNHIDNGPVVCTVATLAVGQSSTCTAKYTVTQADLDRGGDVSNVVTATSTEGATGTDNLDIPIFQSPALNVDKSSETMEVTKAGQVVPYKYVVKNVGNVTLTGITLVDDNVDSPPVCEPVAAGYGAPDNAPTRASFTSFTYMPSIAGGSATALVAADMAAGAAGVTTPAAAGLTLSPGESVICTAQHKVTQAEIDAGGYVKNIATATSAESGPATDDLSIPVVQNPALALAKSLKSNADQDKTGSVSKGDTLTYSFVATNTGNVTLKNVKISDPLSGLSALTCTPSQPASLAPGAQLVCTATRAVTQADVDAGKIANTATATSDNTPPETSSVTVSVPQAPALTLTKAASPATYSYPDQVINYTYVVKNTGNVTLYGPFSISDDKLGTWQCSAINSLAAGCLDHVYATILDHGG